MERLNRTLSLLLTLVVLLSVAFIEVTIACAEAVQNEDVYTEVFMTSTADTENNDLSIQQVDWNEETCYARPMSGIYIRARENEFIRSQLVARTSALLPNAEKHFREENPVVDISFDHRSISAEEVAQLLLTQDDSIDVFELCVDYAFASLVKKGFVADLSSSSILSNEVAMMEPSIAETLFNEQGHLIAYPAELRIWSCAVHEGYWQLVFDDRPLPTNMDELMDAWIDWETEYADEYTDMEFIVGFDYAQYCQKIITFYVQQNDMPDERPNLNTLELRGVLSKLQQVYQIRTQSQRPTSDEATAQSDEKASLVRFRGWDTAMNEQSTTVALTSENSLYDMYMWNYTKIPLTFSDGDTLKTDGTLFVYVVNPYSRNIDAAIKYIECVSSLESEPYIYYAIHPECTKPYEMPGFQNRIEDFIRKKAELEELKKTANDMQLMELADTLAMIYYYDMYIKNQESEKWMISAETIRTHRELLKALDLHRDSLFLGAPGSTADQMIAELCARYASGSLTMDALLDELGNKMRMMQLENQ